MREMKEDDEKKVGLKSYLFSPALFFSSNRPFPLSMYVPLSLCTSLFPSPYLFPFRAALELASRGDAQGVDLLVSDIYGGGLEEHGLPGDVVAASFGKLTNPEVGSMRERERERERKKVRKKKNKGNKKKKKRNGGNKKKKVGKNVM